MSSDQAPPSPIESRVSLIVHSPTVRGRKLQQLFGWNDPDRLVEECIQDLRQVSYGLVRYSIVERIEVDEFPVKADGYRYRPDEFERLWRARRGFHQPDLVDYPRLLEQFGVVQRVNGDRIDEVWLMAFPYAGYYESIMCGPGAFWCNAPPLESVRDAGRRFVVMGFNYERGVGEMLESYGHRAESILARTYERLPAGRNLWERFTRYELRNPGQAEAGNIHFAPNSERDYDWGNPRQVLSGCDDWYEFPQLAGSRRMVNCDEWGGGDIRRHHRWWYEHLPHAAGSTDGIEHNWWSYIADPNRVA